MYILEENTFRRVELSAQPITITPIVIDGLHLRPTSTELQKFLLTRNDLESYLTANDASPLTRQFTAVPGLQINDITADIHLQGSNPGEHQFKLDGVPLFLPQRTIGILGPFSPFAIQSVTIQKSGFGVESGSNLAGVVHARHVLESDRIADVQIDPLAFNARLSLGSAYKGNKSLQIMGATRFSLWSMYQVPQLQNMLNDWSKPDPFLIFAPTQQFPSIDPDFFQDILNVSEIPNTGLSFYDIHLASQLKTSAFSGFQASFYAGSNEYSGTIITDPTEIDAVTEPEFPEDVPFPQFTTAELSLADSYEWQNIAGQVNYHTILGKNALFNIQGRTSLYNLDQSYVLLDSLNQFIGEIPPREEGATVTSEITLPHFDVTDTNSIAEYALETKFDIALNRHSILLGVEGIYNISKLDVLLTSLPNFESNVDFTTSVDLLTDQERVGYESSTSRVALYVNDKIIFSQRFLLELGLRNTYLPDRKTVYAEPRVALRFDFPVNQGTFAMQSAGGLYRQYLLQFDVSTQNAGALFPSKRVWFPINSDIRPPLAYHLSQSFMFQPSNQWSFRLEGFLKLQRRLWFMSYLTRNQDTQFRAENTSFTSIDNLNDILSEGKGITSGVSFSATWNPQPFKASLLYDYTSIRRKSDELFNNTWFSAPWEEPHRLAANLEWTFKDRLFLTSRFTGIWGRSWAYRQAYYDFFGHSDPFSNLANFNFNNPDAHTLPAFVRVDLGLVYNQSINAMNVQFRIDLLNVFDKNNVADQRLIWEDGALVTQNRYYYPFIPTMALRLNW